MTVTISGISTNQLKPGFYGAYNTRGVSGTGSYNQKLLLIGQRLTSGSVAALKLTQAYSPADAASYFGAGSVAHRMVLAAREVDANIAPYIVALDDADASTAATGTVTIAGPATGNGTLVLYVGYTRIECGVILGDTAAVIATRLAAKINAATALPVTASVATAVITLTAKNKGTVGNGIPINYGSSADGVTATITAMTGGATDPAIQAALDLVYPTQFHVIVPWDGGATTLAAIKAHLTSVSDATEQRPGRAFAGVTGAAKAVAAQATLSTGVNNERVSPIYLPGSWTLPYELGAEIGATVAIQTDPSLHFDGVVLPGIHAPDTSVRLSRSEQEALLAAGVTPLEVNADGDVEIVRLVTSRTTTDGEEDHILLDTTSIATLDYFRQEARKTYKKKFPQAKNTSTIRSSIRKQIYDLALSLEKNPGCLNNVEAYKDQFLCEADSTEPTRALMKIPSPVVPGLHQLYAEFELVLSAA